MLSDSSVGHFISHPGACSDVLRDWKTILTSTFVVVICRITKERDMYEKEAIQIEAKNEKLKNEGADEYVLRKQVNFKARN